MGQNSEGYTIRYATMNDLPELCNLLAQLSGTGWNREENYGVRKAFLENCGKDHIFCWIALDKSGIQGTISLYVLQKLIHRGSSVGQIEDVVVDSKCRGTGLGKMLVEHAIEKAWEYGCYKTILHCTHDNVPFYQKCGMVISGGEMRIDKPVSKKIPIPLDYRLPYDGRS